MRGVKIDINIVIKVATCLRGVVNLVGIGRAKVILHPGEVRGDGSEVLLHVVREVLHLVSVADIPPLQLVQAWFLEVLSQLAQCSDFCIPQTDVDRGIDLGLKKFSHYVVENVVAARHVAIIATGLIKIVLKQYCSFTHRLAD